MRHQNSKCYYVYHWKWMTCWYMPSDTVCSKRQSVVLGFFYAILSNISENAVNFSKNQKVIFEEMELLWRVLALFLRASLSSRVRVSFRSSWASAQIFQTFVFSRTWCSRGNGFHKRASFLKTCTVWGLTNQQQSAYAVSPEPGQSHQTGKTGLGHTSGWQRWVQEQQGTSVLLKVVAAP